MVAGVDFPEGHLVWVILNHFPIDGFITIFSRKKLIEKNDKALADICMVKIFKTIHCFRLVFFVRSPVPLNWAKLFWWLLISMTRPIVQVGENGVCQRSLSHSLNLNVFTCRLFKWKLVKIFGAAFVIFFKSQNSHCPGAVADGRILAMTPKLLQLSGSRKKTLKTFSIFGIDLGRFLSLMWCVRDLFPRSLPHELSAAWNLFFKESELYTLSQSEFWGS